MPAFSGIHPWPRPTPHSYRPPVRMSVTAIADASTIGLWYGNAWSIVRKWICFVRCAAAAKSAVGCAETENFGKKKCSIDA